MILHFHYHWAPNILLYLWESAKAMLRKETTALNKYIRKEERFKTNDLSLHPNKPQKGTQIKPKESRGKE